jgi:hypothetical protein
MVQYRPCNGLVVVVLILVFSMLLVLAWAFTVAHAQ